MRCQLSSYTANITYCSQWGTSGTRTGQLQYVISNEAAKPRANSCQYPGLITHVLNVYIPRITNELWMGNNWDLLPAKPSLCEYYSRDRLCTSVPQFKSWHLICQAFKKSIYDLYTNKPWSSSLGWTGDWKVKWDLSSLKRRQSHESITVRVYLTVQKNECPRWPAETVQE